MVVRRPKGGVSRTTRRQKNTVSEYPSIQILFANASKIHSG